jgi:serine/threonine protein kinase
VDTHLGPFEVLETLGSGTFGTVYVARINGDPLRRKVVLKVLKGEHVANPKIMSRTRDEARLLSRLNHPNIVKVERLIELGGRPVVVMEHVQGVSLDRLIERYPGGLPVTVALDLMRQTCLGLHAAYTTKGDEGRPLRVIHRDIKPSNVLLSGHGEVKVVDFGIARGEFEGREAATAHSTVLGSRPYMAPERLDGVPDDPKVDVYSVGMSLYELLTGSLMTFSVNPQSHRTAMQRELQYVKPSGMPPQAVADLRNLISRMCAYERADRPTALESARELEQLIATVEGRHRMALVDFARATVMPLYQATATSPDQTADPEEQSFINEITQGTATSSVTPPPTGAVSVRPALAAAAGVLALAFVAVVAVAIAASFRGDGLVEVRVWIPSDATARVAGTALPGPGTIKVQPGVTVAEIRFANDGPVWQCSFEATRDCAVRYVVEGGRGALSVDDGSAIPCVAGG